MTFIIFMIAWLILLVIVILAKKRLIVKTDEAIRSKSVLPKVRLSEMSYDERRLLEDLYVEGLDYEVES